jgi:putative salt-induced outer membrane protein YdiY
METTVAVGVTLTDGNSETLQANGSIVAEGEKDGLGSVRFGVEGNYGETTVDDADETTVENAKAFGNAKKTLTEKTFAYFDASALYDDIALVDYRVTVGPGLGVYLVQDDTTTLSVEAGPSYVWEKVDDVDDDYTAIRAAERFEHALSDTAKIWQSVEYLPQADDFDNYLLNAELGAEAAMNASMNLRVVLQDRYDSEPAAGLEGNDLTLIAGISLKL